MDVDRLCERRGLFGVFFAACDVLVFSSLNSTESFGIVQIEALSQGTPIVASDLPGVRQPVLRTGMGRIVPIRDSNALASAIIDVLSARADGTRREIRMSIWQVSARNKSRCAMKRNLKGLSMTNKLSSEDLDKIVENQCFHLPYFRAMLRAVEQSFYPREGLPEPVLDVGSGDGHFAWAMLTQQAWFGFDPLA